MEKDKNCVKDMEVKLKIAQSIKSHTRCTKTINDIKKSMIASSNRQYLSKHRPFEKVKTNRNNNNSTSLLFVESLSGRTNSEQHPDLDEGIYDDDKDNDDDDDDSFNQTIQQL